MDSLDQATSRMPIVLIVDPIATSRFTMWRLLSHSFGVLEAPDARRAEDWLQCRKDIDAIVVQRKLPDAEGSDFVGSLATTRAASHALLVTRPLDLRAVATSLSGWFLSRDTRRAAAWMRQVDRLVS